MYLWCVLISQHLFRWTNVNTQKCCHSIVARNVFRIFWNGIFWQLHVFTFSTKNISKVCLLNVAMKGIFAVFFYVYNLVLTFLAAEYKYSHFFKFHIRVIKYQDWGNNTCEVLHFKFNFHQSIYSRPSKDTCIIII